MIKRTALLMIIGVCVCNILQAQTSFKPEWNIGFGAGPAFSTMSISPTLSTSSIKTKSVTGFQAGLSARYISEKHLGFIAELNYSGNGWEEKFDAASDYKYTQKLNYINMPILTHIYFGSDKMRVFFNVGPQIGFLISEKEETNDALQKWLDSKPDPDKNIIAQYNKKADRKFDYGIAAGLGAEFRTGIGNFSLEGRYYMGLGDIYNSNKTDDFQRSANRIMAARLTYYIKVF